MRPLAPVVTLLALLLAASPARARPRYVDLKDPFRPQRRNADLKNPFLVVSTAPTPPPAAAQVGIEVAPMTRDLRRFFGAPPSTGVLVMRVETTGPASNAGVRVGDVIVEVGDARVSDPQSVLDAVADAWVGTQLALTVIRNKNRVRLHSSGAAKTPPPRPVDPDGVIAPDDRGFVGGHPSLDYYETDPDGIMPPYIDDAENGRTRTASRAAHPAPRAPATPAEEVERLRLRLRNVERRLGTLESRQSK